MPHLVAQISQRISECTVYCSMVKYPSRGITSLWRNTYKHTRKTVYCSRKHPREGPTWSLKRPSNGLLEADAARLLFQSASNSAHTINALCPPFGPNFGNYFQMGCLWRPQKSAGGASRLLKQPPSGMFRAATAAVIVQKAPSLYHTVKGTLSTRGRKFTGNLQLGSP